VDMLMMRVRKVVNLADHYRSHPSVLVVWCRTCGFLHGTHTKVSCCVLGALFHWGVGGVGRVCGRERRVRCMSLIKEEAMKQWILT
jgi:hypothetical protein